MTNDSDALLWLTSIYLKGWMTLMFFAYSPEKVYFRGYQKHLYGRKSGKRKVSGKEKREIARRKIYSIHPISQLLQ